MREEMRDRDISFKDRRIRFYLNLNDIQIEEEGI